jgi:hypothetical protein
VRRFPAISEVAKSIKNRGRAATTGKPTIHAALLRICSYRFVDLAAQLQEIYDGEINIRISWLRDGDIEVWLGDGMNAAESTYSASLAPDLRQRAATRRFLPPKAGARVICPYPRNWPA